ncbi:MAG: hypothetical protein KF754_02950 [Planctomycetes bacterium]|nr:hypothetical protein [Planctomycetota bacterium]
MLRTLFLSFALLAPVALCADLVGRHFPNKAEADVAKEFEAGLPAWLQARLKDPDKPRAWVEVSKRRTYVELADVKADELVWAELAQHGVYKELATWGYSPTETQLKIKLSEIPSSQIARWFDYRYRTPEEMVGLACWLASRGDVMAANERLAPLAAKSSLLKPDIEAWLIARHGWPAGATLTETPIHDLERNVDGVLLLTAEAAAQRLKDLDKEAKDVLKALQTAQGNDLKGKSGARKAPPSMRLDFLLSRLERFSKAYAGTATAENKATKKLLEELIEAVKADKDWVENQGYKADRLGIDGDPKACADQWLAIVRANPEDPETLQKAADAQYKAAEVTDNGTKCKDKDRARKGGELWEKYSQIQPLMLNARNYAGLCYMAAGDKGKAKAHFDEVLRRTSKKGISDAEAKHREYAEARLKDLK